MIRFVLQILVIYFIYLVARLIAGQFRRRRDGSADSRPGRFDTSHRDVADGDFEDVRD